MGSKPAPSMPTPKQINAAHKHVTELCPDARIIRVGPDGIAFGYPGESDPNARPVTPLLRKASEKE